MSLYPYSKLYHDMRGGMLKLLCFIKFGRFVSGLVEGHFDDYNLDRFKQFDLEEALNLEPLLVNGLYTSRISLHQWCTVRRCCTIWRI